MKLLSDFDGVWTDPAPEADAVRALMVERTADLSGVAAERVAADLRVLADFALARPAEHGWAPDGRLAAFADEDPLILGNAAADVMRRWGAGEGVPADARAVAERCAAYCAAVLDAGFGSVEAYAEEIYRAGTAGFRAAHGSALLPGAQAAAARLLEQELDVVVVSNSSAEKILHWFELAGIPARSVEERVPDGARCLHVRGSAGKFLLGDGDDRPAFGDRRVFVDRPRYREALHAEAPDVVVGDVFSLDLALPHVLRGREPWAPRHLVLARNAYTPAWSGVERAGGAVDHVVEGLDALCDHLATL